MGHDISQLWLRCRPHNPPETIRFVLLRHLPGDPLGTVPIIEFLDGEGEAVVGAVADAEDLTSAGGTTPA
jgi:hypothetical protein